MSRSARVKDSIFDEVSQLMPGLDPHDIRPIHDRVLIQDLPDEQQIGSIIIPDTAQERGVGKKGLLRIGLVIAVGRGDKWAAEWVERNEVKRRPLGACMACKGSGSTSYEIRTDTYHHDGTNFPCEVCKGDGIRRWRMYVKRGDRVIFDRRKEAEIFIEGIRYCLVHEEQAILAVLEG